MQRNLAEFTTERVPHDDVGVLLRRTQVCLTTPSGHACAIKGGNLEELQINVTVFP